jgi:hypothetical protein
VKVKPDEDQSVCFDRAVRADATHLDRLQREDRDVEIINANADRLNAEARDVLDYQRLP